MNPFSVTLQRLRLVRGYSQKKTAAALSVDPSYLSALERGRKSPPRDPEFFGRLRGALDLSAQEIAELQSCAEAAHALGPFANGASPQQAELALALARSLTALRPSQIRAISAVLEITEPEHRLGTHPLLKEIGSGRA